MKPKNNHDTLRETQTEALTAGALVVILSLFLIGNLQEPLAMTLAGAVLLGSGVYQTQQGWHVALTTWLLGLVLFLGGIGVRLFLVAYLRINWVEIALVAIGGYLIWQNLFRRR